MALNSEKELLQLKKRLTDLAEKSYRQAVFTFSAFLGLAELDVYYRMEQELVFAHPALFGGDEKAERQVIRFGSPEDFGYEERYPIVCVHIKPLLSKFADNFSHRDFLGALMNLGIERSTLGDIRVGNREAYVFCQENIAHYICSQMDRVKHTPVRCKIVQEMKDIPVEEPLLVTVQVASERIDAVIARLYHKSRGDVLELFRCGKVFVDGRLCENNSRMLKPREIVNVRGFGKFDYQGVKNETRKGKLSVQAAVYR